MRTFFVSLVACLLMFSCKEKPKTVSPQGELTLLPVPNRIKKDTFGFLMDHETTIVKSSNAEVNLILEKFQKMISSASSLKLPMASDHTSFNSIQFQLTNADSIVGKEGYALAVSHEGIMLSGRTPEGIYRGMQTLNQLLPDSLFKTRDTLSSILMPGVRITDSPVYEYRGAMLDVARHFFEVEDVKRYIDLIASYKLNTLHLHLADDQGWRIEIKSWPKTYYHRRKN